MNTDKKKLYACWLWGCQARALGIRSNYRQVRRRLIMKKHTCDAMAIRRFVLKTLVRLFVMGTVIAAVFVIMKTPIITNNIAMGQMENSNDWFVAMTMYQKFANVAELFGKAYVAVTLGFIGRDGYKLAKTLKSESTTKTENEKEN